MSAISCNDIIACWIIIVDQTSFFSPAKLTSSITHGNESIWKTCLDICGPKRTESFINWLLAKSSHWQSNIYACGRASLILMATDGAVIFQNIYSVDLWYMEITCIKNNSFLISVRKESTYYSAFNTYIQISAKRGTD